jgi:hypothetical protein
MGCENPSFSTNHHPCAAQCYSSDDYIDLFRRERNVADYGHFFPGSVFELETLPNWSQIGEESRP